MSFCTSIRTGLFWKQWMLYNLLHCIRCNSSTEVLPVWRCCSCWNFTGILNNCWFVHYEKQCSFFSKNRWNSVYENIDVICRFEVIKLHLIQLEALGTKKFWMLIIQTVRNATDTENFTSWRCATWTLYPLVIKLEFSLCGKVGFDGSTSKQMPW